MARDQFHTIVRAAIEKEGWAITADPLLYKSGKITVQMDLGAEQLIAAERDSTKIAIEIKTFSNPSFITALYEAVGKYIIYRNVLRIKEPERVLYLAIPETMYRRYFAEPVILLTLSLEKINLVVYNQKTESIRQWVEN